MSSSAPPARKAKPRRPGLQRRILAIDAGRQSANVPLALAYLRSKEVRECSSTILTFACAHRAGFRRVPAPWESLPPIF